MPYAPEVGTSIRGQLEEREAKILSPYAALNKNSNGRRLPEPDDGCDIRMPFQRDRDRITHSKTFRRLKHKTQVFLSPTGDHYRTRLTHVLEVSQISRTVSAALCLNETLTEAIALGHDLGHTPFGHAGEATLDELHPSGFRHHVHSLRVVDFLENRGRGLNLTFEVRNGIVKHSKGRNDILPEDSGELPVTLEGQVVRASDIIAYVNHDMDDALRAGIIDEGDMPSAIRKVVGERHSKRTGAMVRDLIVETLTASDGRLHFSSDMLEAITSLRTFLYENVYRYYQVHNEFEKAQRIIRDLYHYFLENGLPRRSSSSWEPVGAKWQWPSDQVAHRRVCDFIAGMTDRYALDLYEHIFLPTPWNIR
ncbi:MAG: deoxyguanosinetriphosphate triphosphohydrolase [Desulfobulbaceae bacterium]|uniref:Deoxyguanosinetriphosphate triphosphohydrolase-like protein n=1 Tax=Candidatus Desulfatifera sulfidica TaxID=2841691 RepID=A0A8J6NAZ4_9BACT|nr:deoxyguanosinetriphosphate triphosphohydrolase [Candidatus Desulfatifera sulfidica]